jgi:hypothetical protein
MKSVGPIPLIRRQICKPFAINRAHAAVSADAVRKQLRRILLSDGFVHAERIVARWRMRAWQCPAATNARIYVNYFASQIAVGMLFVLSQNTVPVHRECEIESRALPHFRLHPDLPACALHDLGADRQSYSGAGNFPAMQALERRKDALALVRRNPYTVVAYGKEPLIPSSVCRYRHLRRFLAAVLKSIPDQVLEQLGQLHHVRPHDRQVPKDDPCSRFLYFRF